MNYYNEGLKVSRLDQLMYSDPQHAVFSYSPHSKHLRLLQIQKWVKNNQNNGEPDYFQQSFHLRDLNNSQNIDNFTFVPKRCIMIDNQLAVIQKKQQGEPLNYKKAYKRHVDVELSKKIFYWYSDLQQMLSNNNSQFLKQYCFYEQIKSFCFGRKHFVRSLNSIQLSSDHISRNHCQLIVKKGKTKDDMERYFELLFGIRLNKKNNSNSIQQRKQRLSKGNKLLKITKQLWQIIYSYIFLSRDKYYLVDNGSRNGTFFIECPNMTRKMKQWNKHNYEYDLYGQKIIQNHKLSIKQGYSYQFEGQEYLMKVWRLTQTRESIKQQTQNSLDNEQKQNSISLNYHNQKTIRYIQEFEQKINWFNNFQKVNKDYIIDENLLKIHKWKGKKVYQDMKLKRLKQNQQKQIQYAQRQNHHQIRQYLSQFQDAQRINDFNQSFRLPENQASLSNQNITKLDLIKFIYQQLIIQQKILQKNKITLKDFQHSSFKEEQNNSFEQSQLKKLTVQEISQLKNLFINQHKINTMVLSLDFSNDFKKLYCIITQNEKPNKFHIGSQMVINTARFQFQQNQKCNGYIQFAGSKWNIVALAPNTESMQKKNIKKVDLLNDNQSEDQSDLQQFSIIDKNFKQNYYPSSQNNFARKSKKISQRQQEKEKKIYQLNLHKKLSNKIWTKIPATSLYQLNPQKCSSYLIRLAHSFYFQLKFINFTAEQNN